MKLLVEEISDYFIHFEKIVRINDLENVLFKRANDGMIIVSHEDHITGALTKLAYYKDGRWTGHNARNLDRMIALFKANKNLKPALIRFLSPDNNGTYHINKFFTCAKKRFHISLRKAAKIVHLSHSEKSSQ